MKINSKEGIRSALPKTLRDARQASKKNALSYEQAMLDAIEHFNLSSAKRMKLKAMLGLRPYKGKLLASDMKATDELRRQLIAVLDAHQRQNPTQRFFFLTMMSDEFRVSKKRPILFLKRLRSKGDKLIRMLCKDFDVLGGVGKIEAAFLLYPPDTRVPEYHFHIHAVIWANQEVDYKGLRAALNASSNWRSSLGLDPIRIRELTPERGAAAYWAYYMAKNPVSAQNIVERHDGSFKVMSTTKGYRPDAMMRLVEGLSQCELADLVFGVKDGKFIRDPVTRNTREARKLAHGDLKPVDLSKRRAMFKSLWKGSKAHHDKPWQIYS